MSTESEASKITPAAPGWDFPGSRAGLGAAVAWTRRNLFSSPFNTVLTVLVGLFLAWALPAMFRWAVLNATVTGATRAACGGEGACWTFIQVRLPLFFVGRYPPDERWRVLAALVALIGFCIPVLREGHVRHRGIWFALLFTACPAIVGVLLLGGVFGLPYVDTSLWGGLMIDVVVSFVTVAGAIPLGILLALGRRSQLSVIRGLSIAYIELWRGVPLLTVLFMSAVIVPLLMPNGVTADRLLRAMIAMVLFNAAYMAEVVRGGLQGVPEGQEEAAATLGLRWWQMQALVVLPQALRIVLPGIVNTVVDLFKDVTLITIIGLSDLLGVVNQALKDPAWLGMAREGYAFAAFVFFVCCYLMSSYSRRLERRLNRGHAH
ncbi:amino acid ABC transporter permease [Alsobacter soli]|uniref:Amino acid ABC transporter permease n=1 Tax=Alsobacter soli TaxID=2109933 RepID=A0A2T1HRA9_9HYPH|nr:amino acid ABC transporter permease [Alsobacter soli]PSC04177.1 amino acid ABC transporter permease [Alsobacter soli]